MPHGIAKAALVFEKLTAIVWIQCSMFLTLESYRKLGEMSENSVHVPKGKVESAELPRVDGGRQDKNLQLQTGVR